MNYGIGNVKGKSKSLFTTTTAPTESGGVITLATTDIIESGFKVGDYLAYVDSGNISALYSISAISSGTATLSLVGAFGGGGGKQLYQHNIKIEETNVKALVQIINDSPSLMNTCELIGQWLTNNIGYVESYSANGCLYDSTNKACFIYGIKAHSDYTSRFYLNYSYTVDSQTELKTSTKLIRSTDNPTIVDKVIAL